MIFKIVFKHFRTNDLQDCTTLCLQTKNLMQVGLSFSTGTFNFGPSGHELMTKMAEDMVK